MPTLVAGYLQRATTRWARACFAWLMRSFGSAFGRMALLLSLLCFAVPRVAAAEVSAQLASSATKVEVGQPLRVQLTVSSDEGSPQSPRLTVPGGFGLRGPSVGTRFSTSINGWSAQTRRELEATWEVTAPREGTYNLGPAQAFVEGKPVSSNVLTIQVVPRGTLPAQPAPNARRRPRSLFDDDDFFNGFPGFGRLGRSPLDELLAQPDGLFPAGPPDYHQSSAKDPTAFLVASVSPATAVVGQQVTLRVTAYGAMGRFRESDPREPRRPDFFSIPLIESSEKQQMYTVQIGQTDYLAVRVREYALFPLKAGKLEIGPMQMAFYGSNYVSGTTGQPLVRQSDPLFVEVREPPSDGRPLDYQVGDVGKFQLEASVTPREIRAGDSFSVVATARGEGRLPESLRVPEQTGLEWLSPTISDEQRINARRRLEGHRTFTYIVKATRPGKLNLGKLTLPYFDPELGKYVLAEATLGDLLVQPAAPEANPNPAKPDAGTELQVKLAELAAPRRELRPFTSNTHWSHSTWVLPTMLGLPLGVAVTQVAGAQLLAAWRRRRARRASLSGQASTELGRASELLARGDRDAAVSAIERAIFLGIENATAIKARAILRDKLTDALTAAGIEASVATRLVNLLTQLEAWRFAREGDVVRLLEETTKVVAALPQSRAAGHPGAGNRPS